MNSFIEVVTNTLNWIMENGASISALIIAGTACYTARVGLREYKLKVKSERRQMKSAQAEIDVNISRHFIELLHLAAARGEGYVSEKCIEGFFRQNKLTEKDYEDPSLIAAKIYEACAFNLPVGTENQDAAIMAVAVLGRRYEDLLKDAAVAGLSGISEAKKSEVQRAMEILQMIET